MDLRTRCLITSRSRDQHLLTTETVKHPAYRVIADLTWIKRDKEVEERKLSNKRQESEYASVSEAAKRCDAAVPPIRRALQDGRIEGCKVGHS